MSQFKRFAVPLILALFFVANGSPPVAAQTPQKTINNPQGGTIVFGLVNGATTPAAAMSEVLRTVHSNCGDRPQVGRVFRVRGTNSFAVYFTVVNHPQGNQPVAGLLIAAPSGPNQIEAALVSDSAARFGSTVNPMLNRLFSEWHPGGTAATANAPTGRNSAPVRGGVGDGGGLPPMRRVISRDETASVSLPDGWSLDPRSGGGSATVLGPRGERVFLNQWFLAQDPRSRIFQQQLRNGVGPLPRMIVCPYDVDLTKALPEIIQRFRASNGFGPAPLQIDRADPLPATAGQRSVNAVGQINPDGRGLVEMNILVCATAPNEFGGYHFAVSESRIPLGSTDRQRATAIAIMASFRQNTELVEARVAVQMAPVLAAMRQNWEAQQQALLGRSQQIIAGIKQTGANATARMNAVQAANDAQHAGYYAQQDDNARGIQGFSNYLLDQTVIQDNNLYGNGTVGHGTVWNSTADALVKAYPDRYEIVDNPNFWKGRDF